MIIVEMKLQGVFQRIGETQLNKPTLPELVGSSATIATRENYFSPAQLRQHFGLSFLSLSQVEQMLKENKSISFPPPILYDYFFVFDEGKLTLSPDDLQLPIDWKDGDILGEYSLRLNWNTTAPEGILQTWWDSLYATYQKKFQLLSTSEILLWCLYPPLSIEIIDSQVIFNLDQDELSPVHQQFVAYIQNPQGEEPELYREYQKKYSSNLPFPNLLEIEKDKPFSNFLIGRGNNRSEIIRLIQQAEKYLLISSYIIEDEEIALLISQKKLTLPQGVWILTSLREDVLDYFDNQENEEENHLNERKRNCFSLLLDNRVQIRSGDFHLKTYISEKSAYLGSINLTRGSLDVNFEAGILCQGNSTHQDLINYFRCFWQHKSENELKSDLFGNELNLTEIKNESNSFPISNSLLNFDQYQKDLQNELSQTDKVVKIYTWSFNPSYQISSLLKPRSTQIYINSSSDIKTSYFRVKREERLHAKITIIGEDIAYLGGVNFFFSSSQSFHDLMYKTTNPEEIKNILQQLI